MEETTLLKLDNVEICREENVILHDASFTLHNGEFVYVIGKVGSGKTCTCCCKACGKAKDPSCDRMAGLSHCDLRFVIDLNA